MPCQQGALSLARRDASSANISDIVSLRLGDCRDWKVPSARPTLVITNPPWGMRLMGREGSNQGGAGGSSTEGSYQKQRGASSHRQLIDNLSEESLEVQGRGSRTPSQLSNHDDSIEMAWRSLSDFLRSQCGGSTAYVISGNKVKMINWTSHDK